MKRHYEEIDILYAIGIVLVLIGHSHSSDWSRFSGTVLETLIHVIYTFHMPLFFVIAGFLFYHSDAIERKGFQNWFLDKSLRLLIPYLVLSYGALFPKFYVEHGGFSAFTAMDLLNPVLIPRRGVWGHLWFLPVLWMSYLLFGLWKTKRSEKNQRAMLLGAVIAAMLFYFLPIRTDVLALKDLRGSLVFFALGMSLQAEYENVVKKLTRRGGTARLSLLLAFCALALGVWLTPHAYTSKLVGLCTAVLMIAACWVLAVLGKSNAVARWLSGHNFTIYLYSWLFQSVMMALCDRLDLHWALCFCLMFSVGILGPAALLVLYGRAKPLHCRFFDLILGLR